MMGDEDEDVDVLALAKAKMLQRLRADFAFHEEGAEEEESERSPPSSPPRRSLPPPGDLDSDASLMRRAIAVVVVLVVVVVASLALLATLSIAFPKLLSPGLLAFTFGLRHAVDADHIAAIDNVTRKLLNEGKRPLLVGLWFSLGHSTVVFVLCALVALGSAFVSKHLSSFQDVGSLIGTSVSALVLFLIGAVNLWTCKNILSAWRGVRQRQRELEQGAEKDAERGDGDGAREPLLRGRKPRRGRQFRHRDYIGGPEHAHLVSVVVERGDVRDVGDVGDARDVGEGAAGSGDSGDREVVRLEGPGFLSRCCPGVFAGIDAEWKLYPVGVLFGLGFDTASEVALLALAAAAPKDVSQGIPAAATLVLPLVFTAGMSLLDTLDGLLMLYAYGWAAIGTEKKIVFNLVLTAVSAIIALVVGGIEVLSLLQSELQPAPTGSFWDAVAAINDHFEYVGIGIVAFFVLALCLSLVYARACLGDDVIELEGNEDEDETGERDTDFEGAAGFGEPHVEEPFEPGYDIAAYAREQLRKRLLKQLGSNEDESEEAGNEEAKGEEDAATGATPAQWIEVD